MDNAKRMKTIQGVNELQNPALVNGQGGKATHGARTRQQLFEDEQLVGKPTDELSKLVFRQQLKHTAYSPMIAGRLRVSVVRSSN
ncbi:hypothetical protein QQS21_002021 [Conoideocrella luteorostrata]|uniref:Uncharacterized protein n=1 Tax=Conoideocrella luteorostrata TaxID=1105319 RepID=A0AAJ0CYQ0_9HYPO|nr:hypothetical protein QQS21_002021 [Conoideocrella luteorostrata]